MAGRTRTTSEWALGLLIVALFFLASGTRALAPLEGYVLAFGAEFVAPASGAARVAVIDLDPATAAGLWPAVVERLGSARAVGLVPPFPSSLRDADVQAFGVPVVQGALPRRESAHPSVEFPSGVTVWPASQRPASSLYDQVPGLLTGRPFMPRRLELDRLPVAQTNVAVLDFEPGPDPVFRAPLVVRAGDLWTPGFALRLAALSSGEELGPQALQAGGVVTAAGTLATDRAYRVYPRRAAGDITVVPVADLISGTFQPKDKVVLLGSLDTATVEPVMFAAGGSVAPVVAEARLTAALLDRALFDVPAWSAFAQWGALLFVALVLAAVLPRLSSGTGILLVLLLIFVAVTVELGFISLEASFVPLVTPALALATGAVALLAKKRINARAESLVAELAVANRLLGQSYHTQGQLDGALERYRRCPSDADLMERLYTLGLDFERRRQFGKAATTFDYLLSIAPKFRDVSERLQRNREADGRMLHGSVGAATPTGTVILSSTMGLARPIIGRYEVERELGRGAMGAVYLGRDPKIGRTVAIKTVALSQEFDGEQLESVRERFFREAETAGRLAHPNIVTIYDVGEEQDLAYIAMDYLKGQNLASYCRADSLLPVNETLALAIQVAEALDYAHGRNVVHRDIKPANIVYDRDEGTVKVTDFGVACLTDSSKTRTGTVLGSPSYMSPEQVAGRKVDGRSDLFSLGVMLFQLLTGELPFKGDSLASLMYQIANEKPADIRKLRRNLPSCVARIITKALQKEPERRYQSGAEMARALARCRDGG